MSPPAQQFLESMATRYIWWQTPAESLRHPDRIIAQVMDLATIEDADHMQALFEPSALVTVLRQARPGWFRPRSWSYWHHRLGVLEPHESPPKLPLREVPA